MGKKQEKISKEAENESTEFGYFKLLVCKALWIFCFSHGVNFDIMFAFLLCIVQCFLDLWVNPNSPKHGKCNLYKIEKILFQLTLEISGSEEENVKYYRSIKGKTFTSV